MANTFTASYVGVQGARRVAEGLVTYTDGAAGSSVACGFNILAGVRANPNTAGSFSQYPPTNIEINTSVNGEFKLLSAGSGDKYRVEIVGW